MTMINNKINHHFLSPR